MFTHLHQLPKPNPRSITCIAVHNRDIVTQIHVRSTLKKRNLQPFVVSGLSIGFNVISDPEVIANILKEDAPESLFSIYVSGQREFSDDLPNKQWVLLRNAAAISQGKLPFPFLLAVKRDGINIQDVLSAKYLARPFLRSDLKTTVGYEIRVFTKNKIRSLQVFDDGHGWQVMDEEPVNLGPISLSEPTSAISHKIGHRL